MPAFFHLDLAVGNQLRRIHQQARPIAVDDAADLCQIVAYAEDIRGAAHGHQRDPLPSVPALLVVLRAGAPPARSNPRSPRRPPGSRISEEPGSLRHGSSFELCSRSVFTTTGLSPGSDSATQALGHQVDGLRGVRSKDHVVGCQRRAQHPGADGLDLSDDRLLDLPGLAPCLADGLPDRLKVGVLAALSRLT